MRKFNEEVTARDTCCERYDDAVRRSNQEEPEAAAAVFLASLAYSVARLVDDATSRPAEISGFEGTRDQLAGLTLGKTAAPGESEGETEGPVTPQSALGAAEPPKPVGRIYWDEGEPEWEFDIDPFDPSFPLCESEDDDPLVLESDAIAYALAYAEAQRRELADQACAVAENLCGLTGLPRQELATAIPAAIRRVMGVEK